MLDFARELSAVRSDLVQFPVTYYFREEEAQSAFSVMLPLLWRASAEISAAGQTAFERGAAAIVVSTIREFAEVIGRLFLNFEEIEVEEVLKAYAKDHLNEPSNGPSPGTSRS